MLGVGTPRKHMLLTSINGSFMSNALIDRVQLGTAIISRMSASTWLNSANVTTWLLDTVLPTPLKYVAAHDARTEPIIQPNALGTMSPVVIVADAAPSSLRWELGCRGLRCLQAATTSYATAQ
jgi:hypothetical protein